MSVPLRLFASHSMCTAPVFGSNVHFCSVTAFAPGLTVPVSVLPSYLNSTTTGFRSDALGPQSPVHVPVNGSLLFCGAAFAPIAKQNRMQTRKRVFTRI